MNRERKPKYKVANQLECQQKCVTEAKCVVISYIQENSYYGRCHVCYGRYHHFRSSGWNLHRKPKSPG